VGHAQRLKDVLVDVAVKGDAGDLLHNQRRQGIAVVAIDKDLARGMGPRRHVGRQERAERLDAPGVGVAGVGRVLETGRVGQEVGQGDGFRIGLVKGKGRQVAVDVRIEIELALLDKLHHGGRHKDFGDGADTHDRRSGIDGGLGFEVGDAIPLGVDHLAALDKDKGETRNVQRLELPGEEPVGKGLQVGRVDDNGLGRAGGGGAGRQEQRGQQHQQRDCVSGHHPLLLNSGPAGPSFRPASDAPQRGGPEGATPCQFYPNATT
jgi:hypothetical protein